MSSRLINEWPEHAEQGDYLWTEDDGGSLLVFMNGEWQTALRNVALKSAVVTILDHAFWDIFGQDPRASDEYNGWMERHLEPYGFDESDPS